MKKICLLLMLLLPLCVYAEIYQQIDANGVITYTDQPTSKNATQVKEIRGNVVQSTLTTSEETDPQENTTQDKQENIIHDKGYSAFSILSPAHQESIQNQPTITVTLSVNPPLRSGDMIQMYLDNEPWGNPLPSTEFTFTIPFRGTHHIYAKLLDKRGLPIMTTTTHEIYVHQAHLGVQTTYHIPKRA